MEKIYTATQKYIIMSPRKLRSVVGVIKKMRPVEAVSKLPFIGKRAGEPLAKVIKSAIANARNQGVSETDLSFKEIQIGQGPKLKRGRAASRGRWHGYAKRMSHIRVTLVAIIKKEEPKKDVSKKAKVERKEKKNGTKS